VLTGAAAAEVGTRDEDLTLAGVGNLHHFSGLEVGEEVVAETGLIDPLEKARGNDLVGVDVLGGEAGHARCDAVEFGHGL
jgi:hypothetical protein